MENSVENRMFILKYFEFHQNKLNEILIKIY
jgi:hypothetical protein